MSTTLVTTLFAFTGYAILGNCLIRALAHRTVLRQRTKGFERLPLERLEQHIQNLEATPLDRWDPNLLGPWRNHPITETLRWCLERPARIAEPEQVQTRLAQDIQIPFADLLADAHRNMATAPMWGMLFTILGIMIISHQIGSLGSIQALLAALGPALGTSALGSITAILEKGLIQGRLHPLIDRLHFAGSRLLLALRDSHRAAQSLETGQGQRLRLAEKRVSP
ncbi:MAG: MotA/TolQ/ExbB proton channel family protein [Gammaproteobacteria bacterium]|nr:MotA/TolQ/ExbB proton channel family protein [Gammaproteobacteria bacterium]MBU1654752.1 MotA/TolQ/ExbB proton channel family protein [Gammaproteobacteria bacterium]MBU1961627.1 MotA/TolQ/ExbB proton channel family protein [Gammaproteobacteria bacterium]